MRARHLLGQRAVPARQHGARCGFEHVALRRRHAVRPHDEHAAPRSRPVRRRRRLAAADGRLQESLEVLHVRGRALVEDDQVDGKLLDPPVLVRAQELAHDPEVLRLVDLHEDDRQVAGDAVGPERGRATGVTAEHGRRRPQRPLGVEHAPGQALEQVRLVGADAEVMELHLGLGPRQRGRALERGRVAVLVGEVQGHLTGGRDHRGEGDAHRRPGLDADPAPEADDRIEDRADRVGEGQAVAHGSRAADLPASPEEPGAVGLPLQIAQRLALDDDHVRQPDGLLLGRAGPAAGQQQVELGKALRLHEQVGERRMRRVRSLLGQDDLGVRRHVDLARPAAAVGERDAPDLGVVLGRHDHLERGGDGAVVPDDLGAILGEDDLVAVRLAAAGLVAGRPALAALHVTEEDVRPPDVARDVFPPPREGEIAPAAVPRARAGQHHRVAAVGQQVRPRHGAVRRRESPDHGRHELTLAGGRRHLVGARTGHRDVARRALLQEQLGRLHARVGVKPRAHDAVVQGIGDGDQEHALVVRHVGAHDHQGFPLGEAFARVVESFVEAVRAAPTDLLEMPEVPDRRGGIDHGRQPCRVGRDDDVLAQPAPQAEAGNAEVRVLVRHLEVAHVVAGLRHAPRHVALGAVADLAADDEPGGLLEEAARRRAEHEPGHEVLEHRARPGHEHGILRDRGQRAAEPEPVRDRHVALRDGDEAGQTRLGGQEVVTPRVERALADAVAEREQVALRIEEAAEVRLRDQPLRDPGQPREAPCQRLHQLEIARVAGDRGAHGLRPRQHVLSALAVRVDQRVREVRQLLRAGGELAEPRRPFCRRLGRRRDGGRDHGERAVQAWLGQPARRLGDEQGGVLDPRERGRTEPGALAQRSTGVPERDQVPGEIAAVDGRHVARLERAAVARAVPVVEVATEALEALHRVQRGLEALDGVDRAEPAEVARRDGGQQVQAQVGRRRAVRHDGARIFLEVVGRQRVVLGTDERREEPPGAAAHQPQGARVRGRQRHGARAVPRQAHPAGHHRRADPEQHERPRQGPGLGSQPGDDAGRERGDEERAAHPLIEAQQVHAQTGLRLRGGHPFEQPAARDVDADERPSDRVGREPRLVRQHRQRQRRLRDGQQQIAAHGADVAALGDVAAPGNYAAECRQQDGQRDGGQDERGPRAARGAGGQHPAGDEGQQGRRRRHRAAQVVEHLPARDRRNPGAAEDPRQQLPVAARPAMLSGRRHAVVRGRVLEQLDVGDEPRAGEEALEEVVAQHGVVGDASGQDGLERVHVVDALAGVGALAEQVLVDIRRGAGVRVDPRRAGRDPLEERALAARQRRRDPRLEHGMALHHAPGDGIDPRAIERVRHRADQTLDGAAGQPRVGIQRDDVAHFGRDRRAHRQERGVRRPPQQAIQLVELAPLALPSHPRALALVPAPPAMQNEEAIAAAGRGAVLPVEARDRRARGLQRDRVVSQALGGCVRPVGEQREADVAVRVGEVVHFQPLDLLVDDGPIGEERRHGDQRARARGHAVAELEAREHRGRDQCRDAAVQQRDREVRGRHQGGQCQQDQGGGRERCGGRAQERQRHDRRGEEGEAPEIAGRRRRDVGAKQSAPRRRANTQRRLEGEPAVADEVVAGIRPPAVRVSRALGVRHRLPRHVELGSARAPCDLLDGVPVGVARREVHRAERPVGSQRVVDEADALEELGPVERRHQAHARDHVAHGHVHRRLPLVLHADDVVGRRSLGGQALVEPEKRRRHGRVLIAEPLDELNCEGGGQPSILERLQGGRRALRRWAAHAEELVGQRVGRLA